MDPLVTTQWLADHLGDSDLRVLDASYTSTIPGAPPGNPRASYLAGHVPGALYLDLDDLVDPDAPLPSTVPPAVRFLSRMRALGVGDGSRIVLYDDVPHKTACRAWWLFRLFGVEKVAILDGGLAAWKAERRPLASGEERRRERHFTLLDPRAELRTLGEMKALVADGGTQILDARSPARFSGAETDPRPGVAPGHMPGATNLPYGGFFEADGRWKRGPALRAVFDAAGVDLDRPMVATCGSGITAAAIVFAAHLLGRDAALYDGSWSEWGADPETAKETGTK